MLKRFNILVLCFSFGAIWPVRADEAAKMAKIDQIFTMAKIDMLLSQTLTMIGNQMKAAAFHRTFRGPLTAEQQKMAKEFQDKLTQMLAPALSWNDVKPIYQNLYAKSFTEGEIDGMLAFYKSPAGQAMVSKTPQLMSEANHSVQQKVVAIQPKMQMLMKEYMEKLKAPQGANKP